MHKYDLDMNVQATMMYAVLIALLQCYTVPQSLNNFCRFVQQDNVTNTHTSKDSSGEGELWTVNILVMLIATFLQVLIFLCILDSVLVPLHDIPVDFQPTEIVTWVHLQIFLFTSYVNAAKSSCMLWIINTADAITLVSAHHRANLCIAQGNSAYHAPV